VLAVLGVVIVEVTGLPVEEVDEVEKVPALAVALPPIAVALARPIPDNGLGRPRPIAPYPLVGLVDLEGVRESVRPRVIAASSRTGVEATLPEMEETRCSALSLLGVGATIGVSSCFFPCCSFCSSSVGMSAGLAEPGASEVSWPSPVSASSSASSSSASTLRPLIPIPIAFATTLPRLFIPIAPDPNGRDIGIPLLGPKSSPNPRPSSLNAPKPELKPDEESDHRSVGESLLEPSSRGDAQPEENAKLLGEPVEERFEGVVELEDESDGRVTDEGRAKENVNDP
jgi:hypothetical protein